MDLHNYLQKTKSVQVVLSIDLGNSRTAIAVADQVNESGGKIRVYTDIPIHWELSTINPVQPVQSVVSCVNDDQSFVKVGGHSRFNMRNLLAHPKPGNRSLSSPKRYYFDASRSQAGWLASITEAAKFTGCDYLKGAFADALARRYGCTVPGEMPRAGLLGGLVVELYRQADSYVNSVEFHSKANDSRTRFISHVQITYPTTFSTDEKHRYVLQCQKAMNVWHDIALNNSDPVKHEAPIVEVLSATDEAAAVLGYYADTAIQRAGGNVRSWLASFGRIASGKTSARIAVIDIGGGTSDLTVADIVEGKTPTEAIVLQIYLDGENRAGDDFLTLLIKDCVFPLFRKTVKGSSTLSDKEFNEKYNSFVENDKSIIQPLVSLAYRMVAAVDKGKEQKSVKLCGNDDDRIAILDLMDRIDATKWKDKSEQQQLDSMTIPIDNTVVDAVKKILKNVLGPVFLRMGKKIAAYDCDLLVLAGKPMEWTLLSELVNEFIPMPPWAVARVANLMKEHQDSKFATVLGSLQIALRTLQVVNASSHVGFQVGADLTRGYVWGMTTQPDVANLLINKEAGTELHVDGAGEVRIPFSGQIVYLLRQRFGKTGTVAVTHCISKRDQHRKIGAGAHGIVKTGGGHGDNKDRVQLARVEGFWENGEMLTTDDFDCRIHGFTGGRHWMDDGRIEY